MPEIKKQLNLYASQQIPLSLRGMFYILVSVNILQNLPARYDYLSRFTARAREEYDLPINCFVDGSRYITNIDDKYQTVEEYLQTPIDVINEILLTEYKIPRWYNQPHYVEVWVEKSAMRGILDSSH